MLILHRWFGITVGLFFVLLGLSGSYLVYKDTFQEWVAPGIRTSSGTTGEINLEKAIQAAQQGLKLDLAPTGITISDDPSRNLELAFTGIPGMGRARIIAFVDPVTAKFNGQETFSKTASGFIFFFHHDIFLGGVGRTIMGVAGLVMVFLLVGGLYLWWPFKKSWARVLKLGPMNNAVQANLELHKFFGFYTLILMVMVTFSGVYISKPNWFQKMPERRGLGGPGGGQDSDAPAVDFAKLAPYLLTQPKPVVAQIDARKGSLQLQVANGEKQLLDLNTFGAKEPEPPSPKDMRAIQRQLHGGLFWSEVGKALVFLSGLLPLFFYISGIYVWWKKSKVRRLKKAI